MTMYKVINHGDTTKIRRRHTSIILPRPKRMPQVISNIEIDHSEKETVVRHIIMSAGTEARCIEYVMGDDSLETRDIKAREELITLGKRNHYDNCPTLSTCERAWLDSVDDEYGKNDYLGRSLYVAESGHGVAIRIRGEWIAITQAQFRVYDRMDLSEEIIEEIELYNSVYQ